MNNQKQRTAQNVQKLTIKDKTRLFESRTTLLYLSTALKTSFSFYQMCLQNSQNFNTDLESHNRNLEANLQKFSSNGKSQQKNSNSFSHFSPNLSKVHSKRINEEKQNKKIINTTQTINQKSDGEDKQVFQSSNIKSKKKIIVKQQKIIDKYSSLCKKVLNTEAHRSLDKISVLDVELASLRDQNISKSQIQNKIQHLKKRKVENWQQINKKSLFRKMELKKLMN